MKKDKLIKKNVILIVIALAAFIFIIQFISLSSAVFYACFDRGEFIDFCAAGPPNPDRTCDSSGGCTFCMSNYNETRQCYNQASLNACNKLPPSQQGCQDIGGNSTFDTESPNITILNPDQNGIYNKSTLPFVLGFNEESDVTYMDNINNPGRWLPLCSNCLGYNKSKLFKEGRNNLTIRAVDVLGNPSFRDLIFFIDSKKPIIIKTEPRNNAFSNGNFKIEFKENNPLSLILSYGNNITGLQSHALNVQNDCTLDRGRYTCDTHVDLNSYNAQEIIYWFNLTDIAGSKTGSRPIKVKVDTIAPLINNPGSFYNVTGRRIVFNISVTELNFERLEYIDNSATSPRWTMMCSALRNGVCIKLVTFSAGHHNIDIRAKDKAGNITPLPNIDVNLI